MTPPVRFTRLAEAQLSDIVDWTVGRFGPAQAERYLDTVLERCGAVAEGRVAGRSCAVLVPGAGDLRMVRAGQHFLIWRRGGDAVIVVAILHARSNLPQHLETLERED